MTHSENNYCQKDFDMAGFLAEKGLTILNQGYNVIPIKPGEKFPVIKNWQSYKTKPSDISRWCNNGHAEAGVGIVTGKISFIDLDTPDLDDALYMERTVLRIVGPAPVRIGNSPKRGLMYRAAVPFRKMASKTYLDGQGRECRVEILGIGQQFVSHAIHPVTKRPYLWGDGEGPEFQPADQLTVITEEQAREVIKEFEKLAERRGWTAKATVTLYRNGETDDEWALGQERVGLSAEDLTAKVLAIPNDDTVPYGDDSETQQLGWFKMLAAIHHETGGSETGRRLAYEWSTRAAKHDDERFEKTWGSFGHGGQRPLTARYILRWAKVYGQENVKNLLATLDRARDFDELKAGLSQITVIQPLWKEQLNNLDKEEISSLIQQKAKHSRVSLTRKGALELLKPKPQTNWLKDWTYLTHTAEFYNRETGEHIKREAFDAAHGRYVLDGTASKFALDVVKIPVFHMVMYLPGEGPVFKDASGLVWINSYRDTAPSITVNQPDIVIRHFEHLIADRREIELLLSTLAYIVQTGRRVNYMTIIQGVEGIGKTFIAKMMYAVLGGTPHVHVIDVDTLVGSGFNDWAVGHQFSYIEELFVHDQRFDVLNKMKSCITDDLVSVHPKGAKQYNAINTASYFGFTNRRNALPLDNNDTRYFIILSKWQDREEAARFRAENPEYFINLFRALESPGGIRGWLKSYKLHPEFSPTARAPFSPGKLEVIREMRSELQVLIEDLIEDDIPGISDDLIVVHILRNALPVRSGERFDHAKIMNVLRRIDFRPCIAGRVKMPDRMDYYCWSKNPEIINANKEKLRDWIVWKVDQAGL